MPSDAQNVQLANSTKRHQTQGPAKAPSASQHPPNSVVEFVLDPLLRDGGSTEAAPPGNPNSQAHPLRPAIAKGAPTTTTTTLYASYAYPEPAQSGPESGGA